MFFHRLRHGPTISDIRRNLLVRFRLRRDQFNDLLSQVLRDAYYAVQIANQNVAGMYYSVLIVAVETYRFVDRGDSHRLCGCRGADVSGEYLPNFRITCRVCSPIGMHYRIVEITMLLQVSQPPIDDGPYST